MNFTQPRQRRFRRPAYANLAVAALVLLLVAYRLWFPAPQDVAPGDAGRPTGNMPQDRQSTSPDSDGLSPGDYRVVRIVDGDTLIIPPHQYVRLIGVNAPESVKPESPVEPFGPEASAFTKEFLAAGTARLTFDHERNDQFGRVLAYVWVGDKLLNEELVRAGLARYEPHFQYAEAMKRRYRQAQDEAKRQKLGIWSPDAREWFNRQWNERRNFPRSQPNTNPTDKRPADRQPGARVNRPAASRAPGR